MSAAQTPAMKLVPVEPTADMLYAAMYADAAPSLSRYEDQDDVMSVWSAMLSAAPDHIPDAGEMVAAPDAPSADAGEVERLLAPLFGRLAGFERNGMPSGCDPLTDDDAMSLSVGTIRAIRAALASPTDRADDTVPEGMVAYGPEHPDYPNAPRDWDGGVRGGVRLADGEEWGGWYGEGWATWNLEPTNSRRIIAYTRATPTPDAEDAVLAGRAVLAGEGDGTYNEACDAIRGLLALATPTPAAQPSQVAEDAAMVEVLALLADLMPYAEPARLREEAGALEGTIKRMPVRQLFRRYAALTAPSEPVAGERS